MFRKHLSVVVLVALGLVGAAAWASAQLYQPEPVDPPIALSGSDVGFRIEERRGEAVYGKPDRRGRRRLASSTTINRDISRVRAQSGC
jgi:hypothetical protein